MRLMIQLTLLGLLLCHKPAVAIDAECSACEAVAAELQRRLDAEVPRTHLDMRHRLDKDGNRYGKIINYKLSEMRAVDLLEDLCSSMEDYTIITQTLPSSDASPAAAAAAGDAESPGKQQQEQAKSKAQSGSEELVWVKYKGEGSSSLTQDKRPSKHEEEQRQKQLNTFCGLLLERYEDEVLQALTSDQFEQGVTPVLCQQISNKCKGKQYTQLEVVTDDGKQEL